jgi:hypothetical protein
MIAKFLLVLAAVSTPVLAPAPQWALGEINSDFPPAQYEGEHAAIVVFKNNVSEVCGKGPPGYIIMACASQEKQIIVMPNPCAPEFRAELFAKIMCHEKAHTLGWNRTHDN